MGLSQIDKLKVVLQELIIVNDIPQLELEKLILKTYDKKKELDNKNSKSIKCCECNFPF